MSARYEVVATSLIEQLQGATVELASESVAFTDRLGRVTYVNPAFATLHGLDRAGFVGRRTSELAADDESAARYAEREAARDRGETWFGDVVDRRSDGSSVELELTLWPMRGSRGRVIGWIEVGHDVRIERALEGQLRRSVPLETIGRLVGSTAHDLNNLLTAIRGFAELDSWAHESSGEGTEDLREIVRATERATELIRRVMTFSRESTARLVPVDLALVARNAEPILRRLLGEDIVMRFEEEQVPQVLADAGEIESVLLNLAANARDAMGGAGSFTVRVAPIDLAECDQRYPTVGPGRYAVLVVADSGAGMDEATRDRIFEPFFTTKEPGKGTGLGLANAQSIVKHAGGSIIVDSAPDEGTTFRIFLPAAACQAPRDGASSAICLHDGGHERILLVEDDPSVRVFATRALERHGYRVLGFGDPSAALKYSQFRRTSFDALVTDFVMPGLNGVALARRIANVVPGLRVLYMSASDASETLGEASEHCIVKPFGGCDLADAVGRLFGHGSSRHRAQVVA